MLFLEKYGEYIIRWSVAPELPGAADFAKAVRERGVKPSIDHSDAEYDEVLSAL